LEFIKAFEEDEGGILNVLIEGVGVHFPELRNYNKPEDWRFFPTQWICYRKDREEMAKRVIKNLHEEMT